MGAGRGRLPGGIGRVGRERDRTATHTCRHDSFPYRKSKATLSHAGGGSSSRFYPFRA